MAIAEMSKLKLAGIAYERERVLDALQRSGVVQVIDAAEDAPRQGDVSRERSDAALEALVETAARLDKRKENAEADPIEKFCDVTYEEFMGVSAQAEEAERVTADVLAQLALRAENASVRIRIESALAQTEPYLGLELRFSELRDSGRVRIAAGTIPVETVGNVRAYFSEEPLADLTELGTYGQSVTVLAIVHAAARERAETVLTEAGFSPCPFSEDETAKQKTDRLLAERQSIAERDTQIENALYAYKPQIRLLKIWADYLRYCEEKTNLSRGFETTAKTFCLVAYVPKDCESRVREAVAEVTEAVYFEFSAPSETDEVPTLLRNPKLVQPFEFVSNMYSPPNYRERDTNWVMGIFFMIFFGFIMGDFGYGLLLAAVCIPLGLRMRKQSGSRPLMLILGMGGVFTMVWGLLFGSVFGFTHEQWSVIPPSVMPDPQADASTLLVYSLIAGVVQIAVGFLLKAIRLIGNKAPWDAVFDGFVWVLFCIGVLLLLPMVSESVLNTVLFPAPLAMTYAGAGICGGSLLVAILTAGRHAKGFGKFTKGFGAAYSVIGFFSDVLSYARLFGLMLSGAIIAKIVSDLSLGMITGGGMGIVFGILVLLIGHAFNLAMSVLGAYIHDTRLQYIEFYSRFYEGEGELFRPLGSRLQYVTVKK